jgi:hypothetical protein
MRNYEESADQNCSAILRYRLHRAFAKRVIMHALVPNGTPCQVSLVRSSWKRFANSLVSWAELLDENNLLRCARP